MIRIEVFEEVIKELGWIPGIDFCSDPLGSNSLAVAFYDAYVNSLKQVDSLAGKDGVMNPPFIWPGKFIKLANEAFAIN